MVALVALAACAALGQNAMGGRTPLAPAQLAAREVARLTTLLDLTTAQQTAATTLFTTKFTALQSTQSNMQAARKTLAADVKSNNTSGISADAQAIGNLTAQRVEAEATADAAFYTLLNATQQTKVNTLKLQGMGGQGGLRGPGGFGGPGR